MVVVIANRLKELVVDSELGQTDYKCAEGEYFLPDCIRTLEPLNLDYLIVDVTAIKDVEEIESWKQLRDFFDPRKTIILLDADKEYPSIDILSAMTELGYYNFAKTGESIIRLMRYPNQREDVQDYHRRFLSKQEEVEGKHGKRLTERQEEMREYIDKYNNGEELISKKKEEPLKDQIITGLIILPILTFISAFLIYLFEVGISYIVKPENDYVGEYLYYSFANTDFPPIILIGMLITMLIFIVYFAHLNFKIKKKQMTRGKFMIIPFALYGIVIFGDYYLLGFFEKIYNLVQFIPISDKPYLWQDIYGLTIWIATLVIIIYYWGVWINNSKTLKFEKDLSQKFNIIEKFWVVDYILILLVPLENQVAKAFGKNSLFYEIIDKIYNQPLTMMILVGLEIFLTILILLQPTFEKKEEYQVLTKEELEQEELERKQKEDLE